jgi:hypothetical protein
VPQQLLRLDAFNGGSIASTVSITCAGQAPTQVVVAPNQLTTINPGWTGMCTAVTLGSTNGWNTNFDNLVLSGGSAPAQNTPTPTPTRTPTPTSTPAPTATPTHASTATPTGTPAATTVTFNDLTQLNRVLTGEYPTGIVDWGTNAWYLSAPWRQFTTNSIGFNGAGPTSASFRLVSPRRLVRVDAYNGGTTTSTITIACAGLPTVTTTVSANQLVTIATNWSGTCSSVTLGSTNGWNTNFDNLQLTD